ncbi:MAG: HPP family protein [Candidatus Sericytochromatia bacterium]
MPAELAHVHARELMTARPVAIDGQARLKEAMAMMQQHQITALPVIDDRQRPIGVLSQTDIVRYLYENPEYNLLEVEYFAEEFPEGGLMEFSIDEEQDACVLDVMTPILFSVGPDAPLTVVADEMLARKVHRIFVLDSEGRLDGVISTLDVIRQIRK